MLFELEFEEPFDEELLFEFEELFDDELLFEFEELLDLDLPFDLDFDPRSFDLDLDLDFPSTMPMSVKSFFTSARNCTCSTGAAVFCVKGDLTLANTGPAACAANGKAAVIVMVTAAINLFRCFISFSCMR